MENRYFLNGWESMTFGMAYEKHPQAHDWKYPNTFHFPTLEMFECKSRITGTVEFLIIQLPWA